MHTNKLLSLNLDLGAKKHPLDMPNNKIDLQLLPECHYFN